MIEEKAGRQHQDDMTPARAAQIRTQRIQGHQLSNIEKRAADLKKKEIESNRWNFDRLFQELQIS